MSTLQQRNIAIWLLCLNAVIFCMICLGGVTRLTGSGLSMVQWAPITGILPPLNEVQWRAVFSLYQQTPEFIQVNAGMDLQGFKSIFWFEYGHRILGRLIGILYLLPMLYFFLRYPLPAKLRLQLIGLFVLGGMQGLLGWYMVKSGLVNDPQVSQYRLVAHLGLALLIYVAIFWLGSGYFIRNWVQRYPVPRGLLHVSALLFMLISLTVLAGGFVAGTHAGYAFNTFPLMNGALIPEGYAVMEPVWKNLFENIAAIQFNHRLLASLSLVFAAIVYWHAYRAPLLPAFKRLAGGLLVLVLLQYSLGVATLLTFVPVHLAAIHQAVAIVVLTASLLLLRSIVQINRSAAIPAL